jgi:hypothetical protein
MGVEVKSGGEGVIVADRGCNERCCCDLKTSRMANRKSSVLSRTLLKTRKLLVSTE